MYINIVHFCSKTSFFLGGGDEDNPVVSSISLFYLILSYLFFVNFFHVNKIHLLKKKKKKSDQCSFHAKYDKNASTRACFLKFLREQNNT